MYNPEDKTLEYDYRDVAAEIRETMRRINGVYNIESVLWANIVELNMFEYEDPCKDWCICTPLDDAPDECRDPTLV